MGSEDDFTSLNKFEARYQEFSEPKNKEIVTGASHFWVGIEDRLSNLISSWIENTQVFSNSITLSNSTSPPNSPKEEEEEEEYASHMVYSKTTNQTTEKKQENENKDEKKEDLRESKVVFSRFDD